MVHVPDPKKPETIVHIEDLAEFVFTNSLQEIKLILICGSKKICSLSLIKLRCGE